RSRWRPTCSRVAAAKTSPRVTVGLRRSPRSRAVPRPIRSSSAASARPRMDLKETTQSFLIRGSDYLESHPDFRLVGRDREFRRLCRILMRSKANSVLLVGPGGVGCTALCLGLEAARKDPGTPFDIVNKRIFWLDTDGLFSSGDGATLNENFQKVLRQLSR